jgi:hypothetical protein
MTLAHGAGRSTGRPCAATFSTVTSQDGPNPVELAFHPPLVITKERHMSLDLIEEYESITRKEVAMADKNAIKVKLVKLNEG